MAYGRVEETFWRDPSIRSLKEDERIMMLYLLTCPHKNRLGCFVLDPLYAASDLAWDPERAKSAIAGLESSGRIRTDQRSGVLFIKRFLKHNTLENANVVRGAIKDLSTIPDTLLLNDLLAVVTEFSKPHYRELTEALRNRLPNNTADDSGTVDDTLPYLTVTDTIPENPPPPSGSGLDSPSEVGSFDDLPDGSEFIPSSQRMSASEVLRAWENIQPGPVPEPERRKQRQIARRIADTHTADEVRAAMVGMTKLFPHCPPKNEPWDLSALDRKFAVAIAKGRDHPELRERDAISGFMRGGVR